MNYFLANLITFIFAFIISVIITPLVRRLALKHAFIAIPREDRWHNAPTALFGGMSIFLSVMSVWLCGAFVFADYTTFIQPLMPVALGGTAIFCLGLVDDIFDIKPRNKFVGQVVITGTYVIFGFQTGWFETKSVELAVGIFWIVGITNAFNLLDNMDGLSAGIACIAGFFVFLLLSMMPGSILPAQPVQLLLSSFLGGILGFLLYNFHPASIFMGDAGSLFIGFLLAALSIIEAPSHGQNGALIQQISVLSSPCLILLVPIADTAFVSFNRLRQSRSIFQGGRDHLSHHLVTLGFSEKKTILLLYTAALLSGLFGLSVL